MASLIIDISDGYCAAGCGHCKYGTSKQEAIASFPQTLTDMYLRLKGYAESTTKKVTLSYTNPLMTLPTPTFVGIVDTMSLTLVGTEDIFHRRVNISEKVLALCGGRLSPANIALHIHPPFSLEPVDLGKFLLAVVSIQYDLRNILPYTNIHVALNNNTFVGDLDQTYIDISLLMVKYVALMRSFRKLTIEFVSTGIEQVHYGLQCQSQVAFKGHSMSLAGRFMAPKAEGESSSKDFSLDEKEPDLTLALFPWGVHIGHTTFNINENVRKFSYDEFGKLLDQAIATKVDLRQVCHEAMSARWQKRIAVTPLP